MHSWRMPVLGRVAPTHHPFPPRCRISTPRAPAQDPSAPADRSKLIFQGRVLLDHTVLASLSIKDTDFMVLMKPKPPAVAAAAAAAVASHVPPPMDEQVLVPAPAPSPPPQPAPEPAPQPAVGGAGADEAVVAALCDMGFPRDQVLMALTAAFGNADRAVQYLFDPATMPAPQAAAPAPPSAPAPSPSPAAASPAQPAAGAAFTADSILAAMGGAGAAPPLTPLQQMANEPQLLQLVTLARQNPSALGPLLQELSTSAPHLLHMVQADQQTFQQLLTMDTLPTPAASGAAAPRAPPATAAAGGGGDTFQIQLTRAEAEAIGRLQQLGFSRDQAAQAFLACEKNEALAANLLFDGGF